MLDLNHTQTPVELRRINEQIASVLETSINETFPKTLRVLIDKRDAVITSHLEQISADEAKGFASKELVMHKRLFDVIEPLKNEAKDDLQHLTQSQKAVKKYK